MALGHCLKFIASIFTDLLTRLWILPKIFTKYQKYNSLLSFYNFSVLELTILTLIKLTINRKCNAKVKQPSATCLEKKCVARKKKKKEKKKKHRARNFRAFGAESLSIWMSRTAKPKHTKFICFKQPAFATQNKKTVVY